ncbi:hypothetical protein [Lichenicoccus roseus]|uniref:Uncharacterized protein n=1 Tax=Lichenicoccus roseus TaxID=2683649 RepID=A0A5R9J314_9PROT|nr:hypothetical protein [Lichenicoccus roseus]TLU71233.1 hypothetical protein FE263_17130 [Lichenicoccus roseus]
MGVVIHILERRNVRLDVAGFVQEVGTLRQLSKVTEVDDLRAAELERAKLISSPLAALVAQTVSLPLASGKSVPAHQVIGWDNGRASVAEPGWDYLPLLGYAVRNAERDIFELNELRDGTLHPIDPVRASDLSLLSNGVLVRHGQALISSCIEVRPFIPNFAEADCIFENGRRERLLVRITGGSLPDPSWLVGRKPMEVESYRTDQAASTLS